MIGTGKEEEREREEEGGREGEVRGREEYQHHNTFNCTGLFSGVRSIIERSRY